MRVLSLYTCKNSKDWKIQFQSFGEARSLTRLRKKLIKKMEREGLHIESNGYSEDYKNVESWYIYTKTHFVGYFTSHKIVDSKTNIDGLWIEINKRKLEICDQ